MGGDVSHVPGELGVNEPIEDIGKYLEKSTTASSSTPTRTVSRSGAISHRFSEIRT